MTEPKLNAPKECLFCGAELSGGGNFVAYYKCGSHIWIEKGDIWVIKGHAGICYDKEVLSDKPER